jgi:hypothetical protein
VSILCALISLAVLFFILKYRIHIHVTYQSSSRGSSRPRVKAGNVSSIHPAKGLRGREPRGADSLSAGDDLPRKEIQSALVNLGVERKRASEVAERVCGKPGSFDERLREAIREAA